MRRSRPRNTLPRGTPFPGRARTEVGARSGSNSRSSNSYSQLLITCEHGGNRIPAAYRSRFRGWSGVLESHRGYDPGALDLARDLARALRAPLVASTTSRLVIDLNRSLDNPDLLSKRMQGLSAAERARLIRQHYRPFRTKSRSLIDGAAKPVIHLSIHSFTPVRRGVRRKADIGLLFDPARPGETAFCKRWQQALAAQRPRWTIRLNYPYHGASDGHTTALRRVFGNGHYLGIELEVNQRLVRAGSAAWRRARASIVQSLVISLDAGRGWGE